MSPSVPIQDLLDEQFRGLSDTGTFTTNSSSAYDTGVAFLSNPFTAEVVF